MKKRQTINKYSSNRKNIHSFINPLGRFNHSYFSYIETKIESKKPLTYEELKGLPLKERINKQILMIGDTTDIQKPYANAMEKVGTTRDGSKGKMGKGYYVEGSILFHENKIIPIKLKLVSDDEEKYLSKTGKIEKEFYFYTDLSVETLEDAIVIFKLYMNRRAIEWAVKNVKKSSNRNLMIYSIIIS